MYMNQKTQRSNNFYHLAKLQDIMHTLHRRKKSFLFDSLVFGLHGRQPAYKCRALCCLGGFRVSLVGLSTLALCACEKNGAAKRACASSSILITLGPEIQKKKEKSCVRPAQ